jgi:hypothetical protein
MDVGLRITDDGSRITVNFGKIIRAILMGSPRSTDDGQLCRENSRFREVQGRRITDYGSQMTDHGSRITYDGSQITVYFGKIIRGNSNGEVHGRRTTVNCVGRIGRFRDVNSRRLNVMRTFEMC